MPKLTAIVTTFNEELKIGDCLRRLKFADEILVVDSFRPARARELAGPLLSCRDTSG